MADTIALSDTSKARMLSWIEALESDEYEQARKALSLSDSEDGPFRHCCLGVLCEVAIGSGLPELPRAVVSYSGTEGEYVVSYGADKAYTSAPTEVINWLFDQNVAVDGPVLTPLLNQNELIKLNDDDRYDFTQIAAYLRDQYGLRG